MKRFWDFLLVLAVLMYPAVALAQFASGLGYIKLPAGLAALAPLVFTSGTNLSTAAAGAMEYDGTAAYFTSVASSRQVLDTEQIEVQSSSRTFTANTSAQAIFNATTNGALTLVAGTTYEFEVYAAISGFSASTHTINISFIGGATYTAFTYFYDTQSGSTLAGPTTALSGFVATNAATAFASAVTTTGLTFRVRGTMRVNAAGTFIPTLTQVTNTANAVVQANSFVRVWPVGTGTVTNVGNWSFLLERDLPANDNVPFYLGKTA